MSFTVTVEHSGMDPGELQGRVPAVGEATQPDRIAHALEVGKVLGDANDIAHLDSSRFPPIITACFQDL